MHTKVKILFSAIALCLTITVSGMPANDSLRFEILMSSHMLKAAKIQPEFIGSVDVTSGRHILLSTKNQFWLLGWGGIKPLGKQVTSGMIRSFAFSPDSLLMVIKGNEVCSFDSKGALTKLFKLPGNEMAICAGEKVMYLYDQGNTRSNKAVYVLTQGGKYAVLFESVTPINAVAEWKNTILFASGNMVCQFDIKTKEHKVLATLSKEKTILSITPDPATGRIYFSTSDAIYAINDLTAITISRNIGGLVKFYGGGLMVFDPGKKFLIRITNIEQELKNPVPTEIKKVESKNTAPEALNNLSIIDFVKSGMSDALIIGVIKRSKVDFDLKVDEMIKLAENGVTSDVIMEMKQAMKRQESLKETK